MTGGTRTTPAALTEPAAPCVLPAPRRHRPRVLRPDGLHDLRRRPYRALVYPAGAVLLVTGLPGAGKSTLLDRAVRPGPVLLDAERLGFAWRARLGPVVPYGAYRPLLRVQHYLRVVRAVCGPGAAVVHDSGRNPWLRLAVALLTRARGKTFHLLLLEVTGEEARDGQRQRRRGVPAAVFDRHVRTWTRLRAELARGASGADSCVLLSRPSAREVTRIAFDAPS